MVKEKEHGKKEDRKKPKMSMKEKREAKRAKKAGK
jgi:hypothetical protein